MKIYFVTRFSIYDADFKGFRISRDYEGREYERRLFASDRLNHKFSTFETITFPAVVGQTFKDWHWLIYTSDRLPSEYVCRLNKLVQHYRNVSIRSVKDFQHFFVEVASFAYESPFATVRLDDDDGLDKCYAERLQQYSNETGAIISFTEMTRVKCEAGRVIIGQKMSAKNVALGLAGIGLNVYDCGRHTDIHSRFRVIYDSTPNMLFLNCSPFADTKRGFTTLNRIAVKCNRLFFLLCHRPAEVPGEIVAPFARLLGKRS